ncbi:hypothetical protein QBC37DRAFT_461145 [Rhypophila decipiens]|uniref:Uncharacterized protein n=1 Tax=Rhypophila decipiens TaxID=261697 RepID=A0AAN7B6H5_9PEZI|nr:hypothetical protein QBC37DRAFT_461145 [Rhypophila decipiens]
MDLRSASDGRAQDDSAESLDYESLKSLTSASISLDSSPVPRPPKNGRFKKPLEAPGAYDTYEYSLESMHYPPSYHSESLDNHDHQWKARVFIEFNNMDIFANWDFDWMRRMEEHRWKDEVEIYYDRYAAGRNVEGSSMYVRKMDLAFLAEYPCNKTDGGREGNFRNSWHVSVHIYSKDVGHLDFEISSLRNIIRKETCILYAPQKASRNQVNLLIISLSSLEATQRRDKPNPLIPLNTDDRIYWINFEGSYMSKSTWKSWAAKLCEFYNAKQWDIVDKHFERQLYCLGLARSQKPKRKRYKKKKASSDKRSRDNFISSLYITFREMKHFWLNLQIPAIGKTN